MDEFRTEARLWPTGDLLDLGEDTNNTTVPSTFTRNAASSVAAPPDDTLYSFLFWNTGRHLTTKRRVRWNFSIGGWGVWTATRWYGPTGGTSGQPQITTQAFSIGENEVMSATPIHGGGSSFVNGPGGELAWPFEGNDHVIGTSWGAATVAAKDPYTVGWAEYDFAGWLRLVSGGDPAGEFVETDVVSDGGTDPLSSFEHVPGVTVSVAKNNSANLIAAYGRPAATKPRRPGRETIPELEKERNPFDWIDWRVDPSPEDWRRLATLVDLIRQTRPEGVSTGPAKLAGLSPAELRRALTSAKAESRRVDAVVKSVEAALAKAHK